MKPFSEYVNFSWKRILGHPESVKTDIEHYIDGCQVVICQEHLANKRRQKRE